MIRHLVHLLLKGQVIVDIGGIDRGRLQKDLAIEIDGGIGLGHPHRKGQAIVEIGGIDRGRQLEGQVIGITDRAHLIKDQMIEPIDLIPQSTKRNEC
jgi:hypothetical protein